MQQTIVGLVAGFAVLSVVFRLVDWFQPSPKLRPILRRGFWTDLAYWAFTPLVTRLVTRTAVIIAVVPLALLIYGRVDRDLIQHGFGPAAQLPLWVQAVAILVGGDFIGYWMHRWFHGRSLWRFHAIHHSSVDLDWLSAVRLHPVNDVLMRLAATVPLVAMGFAPIAIAGLVPLLTIMSIVVHANVEWDWGPLRSVIASPRFHRWHHTDELSARDKNFAGLFPLWDILFGTYHMPHDQRPASFGTATPVPNDLIGQLLYPFRRS
jgi:sterol desaturase/sphingolipid hydroxylase (fatty acid hydroxylase superfamily)